MDKTTSIYLRSTLILSSLLSLGLANGLFPAVVNITINNNNNNNNNKKCK